MPVFAIQWVIALQNALLILVIPAAIIIGYRMRGGPLVSISAATLLGFGVFWLSQATMTSTATIVSLYYIFFGSLLLLLGAWALALADATRARRWMWVALLAIACYCTFVVLIAALISPFAACLFLPPQAYCAAANQTMQALIRFGSFAGPVVIMIYALYAMRASAPRRDALLEGLRVSRLETPETAPGSDSER